MKYNKKLLGVVSAFAIALPMSLGSAFANGTVDFLKTSSTGDKVAGAEITFYQAGKKAFTFKTNAEGKVDAASVASANSYDVTNIVDSSGNLSLKAGEYTYAETKAPTGYMLNSRHEALTVTDGLTSNVEIKNNKFKDGLGQVIVKSLDKATSAALGGATVDLKQGDKLLASINFDDKGNVMDASYITADGRNLGLETVDGSILIKPGDYTLVENKASEGYALNTQAYKLTAKSGITTTIEILQEKSSSATSTSEKQTGVKLRIINTSKSAISDQEVSIYAVDKDKKNPRLVFKGKTGADGYLDATKATEGIALLKDGVVSLQPGNYYYQLTGGTNHNDFTVEQDKVTPLEKTIKLNSNSKTGGVTSTTSKSASLAKTGMVGGIAPLVGGGLAIVAGGLAITRRKK